MLLGYIPLFFSYPEEMQERSFHLLHWFVTFVGTRIWYNFKVLRERSDTFGALMTHQIMTTAKIQQKLKEIENADDNDHDEPSSSLGGSEQEDGQDRLGT